MNENKKEGRVLNREPGAFTKREQEIFDDFMSNRHDANRIKENLKKYAGTEWAKQAVEAIFVRQVMMVSKHCEIERLKMVLLVMHQNLLTTLTAHS